MHDQVLDFFILFLVTRGKTVRSRLELLKLIFHVLCQVDKPRVIGVDRLPMGNQFLEISQTFLLLWCQWLDSILLFLDIKEIFLFLWTQIDDTWVIGVQGDAMYD